MMRDRPDTDSHARKLERIIGRMQRIQRAIAASRQPPSRLELEELQALGREYAHIIEQLADGPDDTGPA